MKTAYIVAGVGVVAVVGVVAWLTFGDSNEVVVQDQSQTYTEETSESTPVPETENLSGVDTFANLFKLGRTLECSFSLKDDSKGSNGTAFFDGKNMRVDSMYMGDGRATYTSSMINDGTMMYMWSTTADGSFAMKMPAPAQSNGGSASPVPKSENAAQLDLEAKAQYSCKPWNVDGSVFVPPADITFMDMNEMMKGMPAGMKLPTQ